MFSCKDAAVAMTPATEPDDIDLIDIPDAHSHADLESPHEIDTDDPQRHPESEGMAEDSPADDGTVHLPSMRELGSHLDELRRRLIVSLVVFFPFFILGLALYRTLWGIIILPLNRAAPHLLRFQALGPSDGLLMAMRIAFAFALFLSLPIWASQLWGFVSPGLTARERRWLHLSLGSGVILFCIGAAGAYALGIPFALEYLLPFNQSLDGWENAFTGKGYVDFVISCCFGFGLAFELPLVMFALGWAGLLTPEMLRRSWRVVIFIIFVAAAIMTPPDPFTQLLLALPMLVLFLLGYVLVTWIHRNR